MDNILIYGKDINTGTISQLNSINNVLLLTSVASTAVGTITQFAGTTAPGGWAICNGDAISRTLYSALYDVIGITYGSGNGTTTFNLPDLRTRVPVGLNSSGTFNILGVTGGAETVTLDTTMIPSHTHLQYSDTTAANLAPPYSTGTALTNTNTPAKNTVQASVNGNYVTTSTSGTATVGLTSATGGGLAHNNLQPYIVVNYIIFTGVNTLVTPTGNIVANLSDLADTAIATPTTNQLLKYNGTKWANGTINTSNLTDVTITTPVNNNLLRYNGTAWVNSTISTSNLTDVTITTPATGQNLVYNATTSKWINQNNTLANLTDATITTPATGHTLSYNATTSKWVNQNNTLNNLTDATITSPATGQVLQYNGTEWVNFTMPIIRAWVNFNGTGAIGNQTIRASYNVASVNKTATGTYTITFTSALTDANYVINGMCQTVGADYSDLAINIRYSTTPTVSSFQILTARYGSAQQDSPVVHISVIR